MPSLSTGETLDLQRRAELAINAMTQCLDPKQNYRQFFYIVYEDPPKMHHDFWDFGDGSGRFMDALALARLMTGSRKQLEIDTKLRDFALSLIGQDGLTWVPEGAEFANADLDVREEGGAGSPAVAEMWSQRSTMLGLLDWYLAENDPSQKQYIDRMIAGLLKIAVKEDDYRYYPTSQYYPTGWRRKGPPEPGGGSWNGGLIYPLVRYWEATESPEALELAKGLINFLVYQSKDFGPDGSFGSTVDLRNNHTHAHTSPVAGVLRFAILTDDQPLIDWVRRTYRFVLGLSTSFGWVPKGVYNRPRSETCAITDMIDLAIQFGRSGKSAEWETAERIVRNQFLEQQLTDASWLESETRKEDTPDTSYRDVAARALGSFGSWCSPNDFTRPGHVEVNNYVVMHCCTGHGVRGLYQTWHNIVTERPDGVYVNLWFSRDTHAVRVDSFVPYEGKLQVRVHRAPNVYVRVPEGVGPTEVRATLNGRDASPRRAGAYVRFSALAPGDLLTVSVPLKKRTTKEAAAGVEYTVEWKGNTVVRMSPTGTLAPLYQREEFLTGQAPPVAADYYVPAQEVAW